MKKVFFEEVTPQIWNSYCEETNNASSRHSYYFLDYLEKSYNCKNMSFALINEEKELLALCPIFIEKITISGQTINSLSSGGGPVPLPALRNESNPSRHRKDLHAVFEAIHDICTRNNIERASFVRYPFGAFSKKIEEVSINVFDVLSVGYHPICYNSICIDLTLNEELLLNQLSKYHRKHIKRAEESGQVINIINKDCSIDLIIKEFESYEKAHIAASGRMTRPQASFDLMRDLIKLGYGELFINKLNDIPISFLFCGSFGNQAFGWSQANVKDFEKEYSPRHLLEWKAILYYKKKGLKLYDVGIRYYNGQVAEWCNEKLLNISIFKERYGGMFLPTIYYERFFNKNIFKEIWKTRLNEFESNFFNSYNGS